MKSLRVFFASLLLGIFVPLPSFSANGTSGPQKILVAYVDLDRVFNEHPRMAEMRAELNRLREEAQKQLDNLYEGRLLNETERRELEQLQKLDNPTEQQRRRREELKKLSEDREKELQALESMENLTDQQRQRRAELINWLNQQNRRAMELNQQLQQQIAQKDNELTSQALDSIIKAITAVAEEMGLDMVIDKKAILYAKKEQDITQQVLAKLGAPPSPNTNPAQGTSGGNPAGANVNKSSPNRSASSPKK